MMMMSHVDICFDGRVVFAAFVPATVEGRPFHRALPNKDTTNDHCHWRHFDDDDDDDRRRRHVRWQEANLPFVTRRGSWQ